MATATTATAEGSLPRPPGALCVGRFAPSPTGRLHLGSLTTALASCLEARARRGRWLLRIEDLDTPRIQPGATDAMIHTLAALGFEWDGPIVLQSARSAAYHAALDLLRAQQLVYPCGCSRRQLQEADTEGGYPGTCRHGVGGPPPWSLRFRVQDEQIEVVHDGLMGEVRWPLRELGDPVVQRRDGLMAYQLAVVVDDAAAGVTDIVRGADLLGSTAWQRALQRALALPEPRYVHLPLVTSADGGKLSKSGCAVPLDPARGAEWLHLALTLLRQQPPEALRHAPVRALWEWARPAWNLDALRGCPELRHDGLLPAVPERD